MPVKIKKLILILHFFPHNTNNKAKLLYFCNIMVHDTFLSLLKPRK